MAYTKISLDEILDWLKKNLTEKRYLHSVGTAEYARDLAQEFGLNADKAYIAGLLHDCAKCYPQEEMLEIMDKLEIQESERLSWKTWHAPVSYYVAKTIFGVEDEEILSSIRWHTIGKIDMTNFEKIIFIADKVELKTRTQDYAAPIRELLKEENGLNKAMLLCYKQTIKSLVDRDLKICFETINIYNHLEDVN